MARYIKDATSPTANVDAKLKVSRDFGGFDRESALRERQFLEQQAKEYQDSEAKKAAEKR